MKTKRQSYSGGWKQALSVLLVFALAAGLALGMPAPSGAYAAPVLSAEGDESGVGGTQQPAPGTGAGALNLDSACSVTVELPKTMAGEAVTDLKPEDTVADLYLIAPAVPLSGYDAYAYCIDNGMPCYSEVKAYLEGIENWRTQTLTAAPEGYARPAGLPQNTPEASEWLMFRYAPADLEHAPPDEQEGLAELLAKLLFAPGQAATQPLVESLAPAGTGNIGQPITDLSAGLYLNVVHGEGLSRSDYAVLVRSTDEKAPDGDPLHKVCAVAYSDTKVYTFQPQLLSLPGRTDEDGNATMDTAQAGDWAYHAAVTAKGQFAPRYADLQLEKQLDTLVAGGSAVFIFRITAYDPAEMTKPVYEKVVTLRAESDKPESLRSELITNRIPAGSRVVITEEYCGEGYQFEGAQLGASWNDPAQTAPPPQINATTAANSITITDIPAGRIHLTAPSGDENILQNGTLETVTVTNVPGPPKPPAGGSVINSFTQNETGGWNWAQRSYNAQTGVWETTATASVETTGEG